MLIKEGSITEDLLRYKDGKIKKGLGIGIPEFDKYVSFKRGEFTIILGHDNVGKTYWFFWYALAISSHHNITWTVWSGENKAWQIVRDLIQMYVGKPFKELDYHEIQAYQARIEGWFKFIDNKELYTPDALLKEFKEQTTDAFFIDPFTGLDRDFGYEANYKFLNKVRQFCNSTGKSLYMATHPNSESGRTGRTHPKEHPFAGEIMPVTKEFIEGGKAFGNRVDNFLCIHRYLKVDHMRFTTLVSVDKVKDKETGGDITLRDQEIYCDFNSGLGFQVMGKGGINRMALEIDKIEKELFPEEKGIDTDNEPDDLPF